jgi:hypothetical protein
VIPGTIQPARFLTDTGEIRPGVRQVINVPNPAAGADWTYTVPGGQMCKVVAGTFTVAIAADSGASEYLFVALGSAGITVWRTVYESPDPSVTFPVYISQVSQAYPSGDEGRGVSTSLPNYVLSSGDTVGTEGINYAADDQYSAIALLIDVYYFTDEQLSALEVQKQAAELVYVQQLEETLTRE